MHLLSLAIYISIFFIPRTTAWIVPAKNNGATVPLIFSFNCLRQKQEPNPFTREISSKMYFTRNARRGTYVAQNVDELTNLDLRNTISTEGSHTSYIRGARACLLCTHVLTKINRDFHGTVNILDENSSKYYHVNAFQLQSTERFMQNLLKCQSV